MPLSAYTTYVLHKDHKDLQLERVDSSRNLAQIDLQGFKAKNLRLGINGWHCQPTQHTDSMKTMKSYDTELWTLPGIWKRYFYQGLKQKHLGYVSKPPIHCKAINTCKKTAFQMNLSHIKQHQKHKTISSPLQKQNPTSPLNP